MSKKSSFLPTMLKTCYQNGSFINTSFAYAHKITISLTYERRQTELCTSNGYFLCIDAVKCTENGHLTPNGANARYERKGAKWN